jgi:hypothetical protein
MIFKKIRTNSHTEFLISNGIKWFAVNQWPVVEAQGSKSLLCKGVKIPHIQTKFVSVFVNRTAHVFS